jgi:FAD dependent oxidoreductase
MTMDRNDLHVMVVGGGLGGLATALLLGRQGHRVTLVERDADPPQGDPDQVFSRWARPGVPQARHPHNFLARSVRVLRDRLPDVLESLESRGVLRIPVDLGDGSGDALLCSRRPWLDAGEPISPIRVMARLENSYRRLADGDGPVAGGMVLLGDSCLHTNPTAGRGVSLAFAQAEHLALTVGEAADPLACTASFDSWTDGHVGIWHGPQTQADAAMARRMHAAVAGQLVPPPDPAERLRSAAFHAARTDADVAVALRRMLHLVAGPVKSSAIQR